MRLKTNKTKMYKLVSEFILIPVTLKKTGYKKMYRSTSYVLEWYDDQGNKGRAYLAAVMGSPLLSIETGEIGERFTERKVHRLEINDLIERDMIEFKHDVKTA